MTRLDSNRIAHLEINVKHKGFVVANSDLLCSWQIRWIHDRRAQTLDRLDSLIEYDVDEGIIASDCIIREHSSGDADSRSSKRIWIFDCKREVGYRKWLSKGKIVVWIGPCYDGKDCGRIREGTTDWTHSVLMFGDGNHWMAGSLVRRRSNMKNLTYHPRGMLDQQSL